MTLKPTTEDANKWSTFPHHMFNPKLISTTSIYRTQLIWEANDRPTGQQYHDAPVGSGSHPRLVGWFAYDVWDSPVIAWSNANAYVSWCVTPINSNIDKCTNISSIDPGSYLKQIPSIIIQFLRIFRGSSHWSSPSPRVFHKDSSANLWNKQSQGWCHVM